MMIFSCDKTDTLKLSNEVINDAVTNMSHVMNVLRIHVTSFDKIQIKHWIGQ